MSREDFIFKRLKQVEEGMSLLQGTGLKLNVKTGLSALELNFEQKQQLQAFLYNQLQKEASALAKELEKPRLFARKLT